MKDQKIKYFGVSSWAITNKMTTFVIMTIIIIGGLMTYLSLPRESFPEIIESKIYISSFYPGNAAEDVEKLVTKPLEEQANDISGVTKITSTTVQGYSSIQVEFSEDISPEEAKVKVKDKVDAVKAQPDWPTLDNGSKVEPNIFDLNVSELTPIANINITGDFTSLQLKNYAEKLQDKIESLSEIKEAQLLGVQEKEIEVAVDLYKMTASDLSLNNIIGAIQKENLTISGGNIIQNGIRRNVRVLGEIENPEDLRNIVVKNDNGVVLLGDVAEIKFREKDRTTFARQYGEPVVMLSIMKKSGKNMIEAIDQIKTLIEEAKTTYLPPSLNVTITSDQSTRTEAQVSELENSIIFGVLLVVSVLMFFLGFRNAIFVGIAIPLSIMMSFLLLPVLGAAMGMNITLNTMVLFATVMGLGMLVDNGIVVVENVYRLMDQGIPRLEAAKQGVGEIAWPIIASTATTLAAFLPLGLWPGIMGKFMIYFPLTLATVLGSSLFIALIINAMLTSVFMKTEEEKISTKNLIIITSALVGFGALLIISGLIKSTALLTGIGLLILIIGVVMSFIGWKNWTKTKLLKRGLGITAAGFIFLLLGIFGILGSHGLSGFTAFSKTLLGFGNLFVVLAALLWVHKYVLRSLSNKFQNKLLPALENKYKKFLAFALRGGNAYTFAFGTFGLLIISLIVFVLSKPNVIFFPNNEPNLAIVYIEYPEGTDIVKTNAITREIEELVREELDQYSYTKDGKPYNFMAESIISQVGEGAGNPQTDGGAQNEIPHKGKVTVLFREFKYRKNANGIEVSSNTVLSDLRNKVQGYPGVSIIVDKDQNGPPAGYAINMEISGDDYNVLLNETEKIKNYLESSNIPGVEGLKINVNQNKPEMEVYVDRKKAGQLGLSTQMVGGALRQAIYGIDASTFKEGDDDFDIIVRFDADSRYDENALFNQS
ncbi:MAG: efflux RND transporter permease subunit, partial [Flavobacteriaceae bacterium]|nr:efflux RND transporter permease subunit [Flavobacteriaceae bacterium]